MGNEIQVTNIQQIEVEITILKQQTAQNIIEIGKRLNQAKELLPHGEWGKWLEEKVSFKERTAQNFMRVAKEFPNTHSIADLDQTKIFALLDVPVEERENFIADNNVKDMTTRELKQAIKEKKDAENIAEKYRTQLEREKNKPPKEIEKIPNDYNTYKNQVEEKQKMIENLVNKKNLLERQVELYEENEKIYKKYKEAEDNLSQPVRGFTRNFNATKELSVLVVQIENVLKTELSPVKYSRAIKEAKTDKIVTDNLREIIYRVRDWVDEMESYLPDGDIETVDYEIVEE